MALDQAEVSSVVVLLANIINFHGRSYGEERMDCAYNLAKSPLIAAQAPLAAARASHEVLWLIFRSGSNGPFWEAFVEEYISAEDSEDSIIGASRQFVWVPGVSNGDENGARDH